MTQCRLCRSEELQPVIDAGELPIAHQFSASKNEAFQKLTYPMKMAVCRHCGMGQLEQTIAPEILYSGYNYCFSSWKHQPHIKDECELIKQLIPAGTLVEVGCNDGLFLSQIAEYGDYKCIGIEPNKVSSVTARKRGFKVINKFFEQAIEEDIQNINPDVIVARQVLEHINDVDLFLATANRMMDEGGLLCLEVPNTDIALRTGDVSCLWEEHVNYFTPASLKAAVEGFGFEVCIEKTYQFSGEALLIIARKHADVESFKLPEKCDLSLYQQYPEKVAQYTELLHGKIEEFKAAGYKIAVYGSGCRASTSIHSLNIADKVDFILDDQQEKQSLYMPQVGVPVVASDVLTKDDAVLFLLAVNNENEVKVNARIASLGLVQCKVASMHSPKAIINELLELEHATA